MDFIGSHILTVAQFQRRDIENVFDVADTEAVSAIRKGMPN